MPSINISGSDEVDGEKLNSLGFSLSLKSLLATDVVQWEIMGGFRQILNIILVSSIKLRKPYSTKQSMNDNFKNAG